MGNDIKALAFFGVIVIIVLLVVNLMFDKCEKVNIDKSEFHSACLKAGYSVDECEFEWIKETL